MQHLTSFLALLALLSGSLPPSTSTTTPSTGTDPDNHGDIDRWCRDTPHPDVCHSSFTNATLPYPPKRRSEFYSLSLHLALGAAGRARRLVDGLGPSCRSHGERAALADCCQLYADAALLLNRTCGASSRLDAQTWLSAALTNLAQCHGGFGDLGVPATVIAPAARYNVSEIISNLLAINADNDSANDSESAAGEAPSWMMFPHRKLLQASAQSADLIVAQDGSGNFRTIKEAFDAAAAQAGRGRTNGRFVIYVKAGVYNEVLQVGRALSDLTLVGDGMGNTVITGSRSAGNGYTTFSSATFSVFGDGFMATGVTFRNTYGAGAQAVALLSASDLSVFYRCSFEGYQDTLCAFSQRQFYRECDVHGTVDFVFGNAAAVLQNCTLYARRPAPGEANVIAAQGRSDPNQNTGTVIQSSVVRAAPELYPALPTVRTYLGRPWQPYARTLYVRNYIDSVVDPAGWTQLGDGSVLSTLYFVEYGNMGPGAGLSSRVQWPGYHVEVRPSAISSFTASRFVAGRMWIPATGVPFSPGF